MLGKKSKQQTKNKEKNKNYKPKANDRGKENNSICFETWPSYEMKIKYRRAVHHMSE